MCRKIITDQWLAYLKKNYSIQPKEMQIQQKKTLVTKNNLKMSSKIKKITTNKRNRLRKKCKKKYSKITKKNSLPMKIKLIKNWLPNKRRKT